MKKRLVQKLAQLIDSMPIGMNRSDVIKDYLQLKITEDDRYVLTLTNKYKEYVE
jgi:metal-responsive CopG/Arc/MetJ family transcriptional regulator